MGSSSSKPNAGESPSGDRRNRSKGRRVFQSYCLGSSSESRDSEDDEQVSGRQTKGNCSAGPCASQTKPVSGQLNAEKYRKVKVEQPNEITLASSNVELGEWGPSSLSDTVSRAGSTSSRRSSNPSSRFLSRFSFFPGNVSFRLSRATSLGSSRAYPVPSTSFAVSNDDELHLQTGPATGLVNRNEIPQDLSSGSSLGLNSSTSLFSDNLRDDHITSAQDGAGYIDNTRDEFNIGLCSPRNRIETDDIETRLTDRRFGVREPVEQNVQFSRTLSVGRLRDRVLRRPSFPDIISSPLQQESEVVDAGQGNGRPVSGGALVSPISSGYSQSIMPSSLYNGQDYEVETSRAREVRYHDLLEHRSNFLERRRRIRSQVRALQRMGSRFGNLSVHERSCILSGQHRNGRCTCRANARDGNSNDNNGARASISRLVMLAEALFEVLDEIHQQTVALSSRPSMSSIGSVPAPNEVVESLPVKLYSKLEKNLIDEDAQCYICLVEYEEGDSIRVLPCHHEFHRPCIDKWLKEVHRICPLCRGDICRTDSLPAEN